MNWNCPHPRFSSSTTAWPCAAKSGPRAPWPRATASNWCASWPAVSGLLLFVSLHADDLRDAVTVLGGHVDLFADLVAHEGLGERALITHDALFRVAIPRAERSE